MLPWLLFFMYTFLLLAALYRLAATRKIAIRPPVLAAAFLLKVGLGCLYGFIFLKYYGGDDTWNYHRESILEQGKLLHHTGEFFRDLLPGRPFGASHSWLEGIHYYLMDLEYWAIVKTLALFNFLSGGNYYINVLFFDALVFAGPLLLFKLCSGLFPQREKLLCIGLFFIPSVTFWLSGIRSEGLLLLSMAVVFYYYYQWTRRRTLRSALLCTAGLLGILVFRSEFLFTFIPAFLGLVLAKRNPSKSIYYFFFIYIVALLLFFASSGLPGPLNLPAVIALKQQEFFRLRANTLLPLDRLQPTLPGFLRVLPQAFSNTCLRPFPWEAKGPLQMLASLDIAGCWALAGALVFYRRRDWRTLAGNPLVLTMLFYSTAQILLIGFTVPFPGAIIRYKSVPELLLLLSLLVMIDPERKSFKLK